ncbi:hypothetical protein C4J81_16585 [Deltaproteobacteria bacterium Smac51]|nr:hypothetical protein C4J81_16585 [Deltaproteobacteria bacterium Smac51]
MRTAFQVLQEGSGLLFGEKAAPAIVLFGDGYLCGRVFPLIHSPFGQIIVNAAHQADDMADRGGSPAFFDQPVFYHFQIAGFYRLQGARAQDRPQVGLVAFNVVVGPSQVLYMAFPGHVPSLIQSQITADYFFVTANATDTFSPDLIGQGGGVAFRGPADFLPFAFSILLIFDVPSLIRAALVFFDCRGLAENAGVFGFYIAGHGEILCIFNPGGQVECLRFAYAKTAFCLHLPTGFRYGENDYNAGGLVFSRLLTLQSEFAACNLIPLVSDLTFAMPRPGVRSPSSPPIDQTKPGKVSKTLPGLVFLVSTYV